MKTRARLTRLENVHAAASTDICSLTDDQLVACMRNHAALLGLDWATFRNDPAGTIREHFDGFEDEPGLIHELLTALERAGTEWLQDA